MGFKEHYPGVVWFLYDVIEGLITEVKGVGGRKTQLLDYFRNRRRYWELKEEVEDRKRWKQQFINRTYQVYGFCERKKKKK